MIEILKLWGDWLAATFTVGALFSLLPDFLVVLTIIYTAVRLWETKTVQKLIGKK